jgi:hypothetical protein
VINELRESDKDEKEEEIVEGTGTIGEWVKKTNAKLNNKKPTQEELHGYNQVNASYSATKKKEDKNVRNKID